MKKTKEETRTLDVVGKKCNYESILIDTFKSLEFKGYEPIIQIIGYIISGDPTYITTYNNARKNMCEIPPTDLLIFLMDEFFKEKMNTKD